MVLTVVNLLQLAAAQVSPTTEKAGEVRITQGPEIERGPRFCDYQVDHQQPRRLPEHYGVVHYGTNPANLDQTAKSPIRLNPAHSYTVFRVRLQGLKPATTYYYKVGALEASGNSDRMASPVGHFTTPR